MPIGWVAAASAVTGIVGSVLQSNAASDAANAQAGAAANAQQISQNEFNTITAQNAPFMNAGYGALNALEYGLGIGGGPAPVASATPTSTPSPVQGGGWIPNISGPLQPGGTYVSTDPQSLRDFMSLGSAGNGSPGYDPSSGYRIGPGGRISQMIPGGTMGFQQGLGGLGIPISAQPQSAPMTTGGLGYGSLTKPFDVSDWQQLSPAYNFQRQQGTQGVLNADTSGQGALSGSAMKDLIDYNQSAANTSFNSAFNQYQTQQGNIFSRLSGIAQLGQASANNTGQQGTALAGQAAQSATNIGTAQAGGIVGSANAISGGLSSSIPWLAAGNWGGGSGGPNTGAIDNMASSTAGDIASWDVAPVG